MSLKFIASENRDASQVIRGFLYQIELTIKRWIELEESAILELERGEDIDIVQQAFSLSPTRTLEQIKLRSSAVSLRSPEILQALVNFFLHFSTNPDINLRFRYLTNAQTAVERGINLGGKKSVLQVWNAFSAGQLVASEKASFLDKVREVLQTTNRPEHVRITDWKIFRAFFEKDSADLSTFTGHVEWSFGHPEIPDTAAEIEESLAQTGYVGTGDLRRAHHQLLSFVINRLSSKGLKRLTRPELVTELRDVQKSSVNPALIGVISALLQPDSRADQLYRDVMQALNRIAQVQATRPVHLDPKPPTIVTTIPTSLVGGSKRSENVEKCLQTLRHVTWLALYAESGAGKTQLAILLTERVSNPVWISFRNISPDQMGNLLDSHLAYLSRVPPEGELRRWYMAVCDRLPSGTTFVADDISFDGTSEVCSKLCLLAECAVGTDMKLVSTAWNRIIPTPSDQLGAQFVEIAVPRFSDAEIKEVFGNRGAPKSLFTDASFLQLIGSVTRRHPQIIGALVRYMEQSGWRYDTETITRVIRGDFAEDLKLQTRRVLANTVPEDTRELLYRLNIVGPLITDEDVARVGNVPPPITLPIDKVAECVGVWIQRLTTDTFMISPLIDQLGSANVQDDVRKLVHVEKARAILLKKALDQFDALAAITHFAKGGADRDAAQVLLVALNELNDRRSRGLNDFGLLEIWTTIELPVGVPIGSQLVIRSLQISARKRHSKPFLPLLATFDRTLKRAKDSDQVAAFASCAMLAVALADTHSRQALAYAISALHLEDRVQGLLPSEWSIRAAEIIWICAPGVETPADLHSLLDNVGRLSPNQIQHTFDSEIAAQSCRFICDRFWMSEADKLVPQWDTLEAHLKEIAARALEFRANVLLAAVTRARIVIAADYQKNIGKATALADEVMSHLQSDKRAAFLVAFTVGTSCCDFENWDEGLTWLTRATELNDHSFADFYARAFLSRAQALRRKGMSARADCLRAVEFGRESKSVSELTLIRCLGEYSICLWDEGDEQQFFETWQETIERILASKTQANAWKELFVLTGNNTGYFAASEKGIEPLSNMTRPFQGMYLLYSPKLPEMYAPETEWYMPASMVWLAERIGRYRESSRWALRATELAAGSPIGADAKTLLMYATPEAIRERRYLEALAFVEQAAEGMQAPREALSAWAEKRGNEEFKKIIEARPKPKPSLNNELLTLTVIPILIDLLIWHMTDRDMAVKAARSVIETCQELADHSDNAEAWIATGRALEQVFSGETTLDLMVETARQHSKENRYLPALICYLGTATVGTPESTCTYWLSPLEFYERQFSKSRLHIQLVAESVTTFWRAVAVTASFAFRQPTTLQRKLEEFAIRPDLLPRHSMGVVVWHLGLQLPPQAEKWLEGE